MSATAKNTYTAKMDPLRGLVDPDQLVCPGCGEQVRCAPPGYWLVVEGLPAPAFSHRDATPLCRDTDGHPAEPIEVRS
jgi:hypothetical protein